MEIYYQCSLSQGDVHLVSWIEARGAKPGARVEIPEFGGLWRVDDVFTPGLPKKALIAKQNNDRNCSLVTA